jgi:CRISPR/Cas system-associated exonuclease Cas4 (RecB family)
LKPFLLEIAESIYSTHGKKLDNATLVFPNRRAALYFRKHLTSLLDKPAFSPTLLTIEDFISGFSTLKVPDKLELIHTLQGVYNNVLSRTEGEAPKHEPFDQFYFWGEMLLRDFDEADKYMATADLLFKDLSHQKEVDNTFDFLTDEQREFLRSFWINFDEKDSLNKQKFLRIWRQLPSVYAVFKSTLKQQGLAFEGMLHRDVAENIRELFVKVQHPYYRSGSKLYFIGFNALTKAEERIISFFIEEGIGTVKWDIDDYYFNNQRQEAARFFREYSQHRLLARTFPQDIPSNFKSQKEVKLYGASQPLGQAKLMTQVLKDLLAEGTDPEETLIVLPDEKLLMPVLHGVAGLVDKLNVTMGFPLSSTPLFNFVELLVELQLTQKNGDFNHRPVVTLLGHPYVVAADAAVAHAKRKDILQQNRVHVHESLLSTQVDLHRKIFVPLEKSSGSVRIIGYIRSVVYEIGMLQGVEEFDKEYCFHFVKLLNKMEEVFERSFSNAAVPGGEPKEESDLKDKLKAFLRLFRQLLKGEKIPFSGEPLKGLQVMGVLETRNLDFKNVFILSLNEGAFPSFSSKGSYIPYNIRKAYGLPTVDQQDAMYAYLFYRSLQRAENIFLFYNSETDDLGQGEMSRYLQQLLYESGLTIEKNVLHNEFQPYTSSPISIWKDDRVFNELANYCAGSKAAKTLSPSALNDYIECRLKFYFKYVARVREPREVEEELDARVLGNFLHRVMELFYQRIIQRKGNNTVEQNDFDDYDAQINELIDVAFIANYGLDPKKKVVYEGQRLVVREIVKRFVDRILKMDRAYAPFTLEALERKDLAYSIRLEEHGRPIVVLGGSIDRADRKGDIVRVIDYKTGKDSLDFSDIPSLFKPGFNRNKAAFQTLLYTLLYKKNVVRYTNVKLVPGLMNRINLFNEDFVFGLQQGNQSLQDATPLLPQFEEAVKELLTEIFDPSVPFDQTKEEEVCRFCQYKQVCYR